MSTMQLEFAQAMSDFKTMFPDMDHDVIEAVLRANHGAVDATINNLIEMSTDNQNEKLRNELDSPNKGVGGGGGDATKTNKSLGATTPTKRLETVDTRASASSPMGNLISLTSVTGASPKVKKTGVSLSSSPNQTVGLEPIPESTKSRWKPPLLGPLPPTFLRIENPGTRSDCDIPDEQFAMMLQNEEFMNELKWNQEFMSSLEKEHGKGRPDDDAAFKERLRYMGKKSRKKFMQLARVFTWQRPGSNKKGTSQKHDPPHDSLLLQEDYDEDDIDHPKQQAALHQGK